MKNLFLLLVLCLTMISCKKEVIEPNVIESTPCEVLDNIDNISGVWTLDTMNYVDQSGNLQPWPFGTVVHTTNVITNTSWHTDGQGMEYVPQCDYLIFDGRHYELLVLTPNLMVLNEINSTITLKYRFRYTR